MRHILTTFLLAGSLMAAPALATDATSTTAVQTQQWEYLVVSYGKAYFSSPLDSNNKQSGSKVINYGPLGLTLPDEALSMQKNMDILGKYGWELVSVVGSIGGDQELLFRRKFDPTRTTQELESIKKEADLLKAAEEKAKANPPVTPASPSQPEEINLVDLDAVDAENARAQIEKNQIESLKSTLTKLQDFKFNIAAIKADGKQGYSHSEEITLDLDVTHLMKDGTYRKSIVNTYAKNFVQAFLKNHNVSLRYAEYSSICISGGLQVRVNSLITYKGKKIQVDSEWRCLGF